MKVPLEIPGGTRMQVRGRERQMCVRCGMRGAEIHHRRSKSVRDGHTHCPCNLVYLCGWGNHTGCHGWAHSNPFEAKASGLIVSKTVAIPGSVPVLVVVEGLLTLTCDGQRVPVPANPAAGAPESASVAHLHQQP